MDMLGTEKGFAYFTFTHNQSYQELQFKFYEAVESLQPQNIMVSYHIDTIIVQVSSEPF